MLVELTPPAPPQTLGSVALTDNIVSELMLGDVLEEGGEDRQQGHGGVGDVLAHTLHLRACLRHLAEPQVLHHLLNVLRGTLKEGTEASLHDLGARLHHGPRREVGALCNLRFEIAESPGEQGLGAAEGRGRMGVGTMTHGPTWHPGSVPGCEDS